MIEKTASGAVVFTGNDIQRYQFIVLRASLALEAVGLKRRGPMNAASTVRTLLGSRTRNKRALFHEFDSWMVGQGFKPFPIAV